MGSMDQSFCTLIGLACWLEIALTHGDLDEIVFGIEGTTNPFSIKQSASKYLMDILRGDGFHELVDNF